MGASASQPVVRVELLGWKCPIISDHEVVRLVPPPSDEYAVVLLARDGYEWPKPNSTWWLVESPWHYVGEVMYSNGAGDPFVPAVESSENLRITPPPEFVFESYVENNESPQR